MERSVGIFKHESDAAGVSENTTNQSHTHTSRHSPIGQIIIIVIVMQTFAKQVRVAQIATLQVTLSGVQTVHEVAAGRAGEASSAARGHRVRRELRGGLGAQVTAAGG